MLGEYDNGLGQRWQDAHPIRFFNDGAVSYPYLSDGMWFLTQFRRWGLLKAAPDYAGIAHALTRPRSGRMPPRRWGHLHTDFTCTQQHIDGRHRLERYRPGRIRQPFRHSP
jgi:hypothetical protein